MTFVVATKNEGKLKEIKNILSSLDINAISLNDLDVNVDDIEETGKTFEENAKIKAQTVFNIVGKPCIADDSGLVVDALNGEPGVYSKRYGGEDTNDEKNIQKLLKKLEFIPENKRTARFVCAVCCILEDGESIFAQGYCEGKIGFNKKGENGFGYDPVFITKDGKNMAELSETEKNKISHRSQALKLLASKLKEKLDVKR